MSLPSIVFSKEQLANFEEAVKNEWLVTNGLGGYASSTVEGLNNRKYHALLVAALRPPGERTVVLSKLDEDIDFGGQTYQLGANDFRSNIYPQGYRFLKEFSISPFPKSTFEVGDLLLEKTVILQHGKNSVIVLYNVSNAASNEATVKIYPLLSYRHYHYTINRSINPVWIDQKETENTVELTFNNPASSVIIRAIEGIFTKRPVWIEGVFYREEENRGEGSTDESYQPGYFEFQARGNGITKFAVVTAVNDTYEETTRTLNNLGPNVIGIEKSIASELSFQSSIQSSFYNVNKQVKANDGLNWLLKAANDFIVKGTGDRRFVIAGYQWFGSWGRDTFVSLPGLMLATGRLEDARSVILDYTNYCRQGLIPNLIDDKTGEPLYNTVDGTLWYINSVLQFLKYSGGFEFVRKLLWPTLNEIIQNHRRGTLNGIHVDTDGLLAHGPQLTWMDAVVDNAPVTPRAGKAVEVQALWYNALRTMQLLALRYSEKGIAEDYSKMAEQAKQSFNAKFWNNQDNCLFDVVEKNGNPDFSIRPNQVIVAALDFQLLDKEKAKIVTDYVTNELLTPVGLRTLSPKDPRYRGTYENGRASRDMAYHSGTVWPWLTGPLTTAYLKANGYDDFNVKSAMEHFLAPLLNDELKRGGLGTINEIYDADPPHLPKGCIAQAWSVAEPLRAYIEDILQVRPKYEKEVFQIIQPIS